MSEFTENLKERITLLEAQMAEDAKVLESYRYILQKEEANTVPGKPVSSPLPSQWPRITLSEAVAPIFDGVTVSETEEEEEPAQDTKDLSNEEFIVSIVKAARGKGVPPRDINEASIAAGRITRGSNAVYSQLNTLKKKDILIAEDGLYYLTPTAKKTYKVLRTKAAAAGA